MRFPKGQLFVALCLLAAWIGSTVETAGAPPPLGGHTCQWWTCKGFGRNQ